MRTRRRNRKQRRNRNSPRAGDVLPSWLYLGESLIRFSPLTAALARSGAGSRVRSTAAGGLLLMRFPLCATPSGSARLSVRRTRSQLRHGAVQGGLGALPPTSEMGIAASAGFPFWPVCINTGIACRFLCSRLSASITPRPLRHREPARSDPAPSLSARRPSRCSPPAFYKQGTYGI